MTIEVIKKGSAHIGPTYEVTCTRCESVLQFRRADFVQPVDRNEAGHIDCPVCHAARRRR